jgi:hypothetical protein
MAKAGENIKSHFRFTQHLYGFTTSHAFPRIHLPRFRDQPQAIQYLTDTGRRKPAHESKKIVARTVKNRT